MGSLATATAQSHAAANDIYPSVARQQAAQRTLARARGGPVRQGEVALVELFYSRAGDGAPTCTFIACTNQGIKHLVPKSAEWCASCNASIFAGIAARHPRFATSGFTSPKDHAMKKSTLRRSLAHIAAAVVLASAGSAHAANYMGSFDPVDFSGSYTISIDDTCLSVGGGNAWIPNDGSLCPLGQFFGASVNIVSTTPPDPAYTGTLGFVPANGVTSLIGFLIQNGEFAAPDTTLIPLTSASPSTSDSWFIQFTSAQCGDGVPQSPPSCTGNNFTPSGSADYLEVHEIFPGPGFVLQQVVNPPGNVFIYVNPRAAPEPGTLALLAGALGAGWFARRGTKSAD